MKNKVKSVSNNLAFKSASAYMISNLLLNASSILTAPLFSRILTTSDYGVVSNFMAWQSIGLITIGLALSYTIGNAKLDFPLHFNDYIASIQSLSTICGLIVFVFSIMFLDQLASFTLLDKNLIIFINVYLLFLPSVIYSQEKYKFDNDYKKNIAISIFNTLGSIFFCLLFILFIFPESKYIGRILGLIIPMFFLGIYYYILILKRGFRFQLYKYWLYALKISLPIIPHTLGMVILTQLDRIMIIKLSGTSDAGLYSFGFSYAVIISVILNSISQALQPWIYQNYRNNNFTSIKSTSNMVIFGISNLALIIIVIGPEVIKILGPENFGDAKLVIMPIVIASFFQYIAATYSTIQLYHKKTIFIPVGTLIAGILNYFLNIYLIPIFGFQGAAFATFFSFLSLAIIHMFFCKKIAQKVVYDDRYIWVVSLATVFFSFIIMQFYNMFILRYAFFIIVLSLNFYIQKNKTMYLYNFLKSKILTSKKITI